MPSLPDDGVLFHFIRESNRIEGIEVGDEHYLFTDHLNAVRYVLERVATGELPEVKRVHMRLMASSLGDAGQFRSEPMGIVDEDGTVLNEMPSALHVESLMEEWQEYYELCAGEWKEALTNEADASVLASDLHHRLLCIHPFSDGNGRCSRLILNGLRLSFGLPWLTIKYRDRDAYFGIVMGYEEQVFKPQHPDVY